MPPTIEVKSPDDGIRAQREATAQRVINLHGDQLPDASLLCLLDDQDWQPFKAATGARSRGFYKPVRRKDSDWEMAPYYVVKSLFDVEGRPLFDNFVYLYGSTCSTDLGLAMTLSHELRHFVQHDLLPTLWAANALVTRLLSDLSMPEVRAMGVSGWCDVPHERDAMLAAKSAAEGLFGIELVTRYIDSKIAQRVTDQDADDWRCIRGLVTSAAFDWVNETRLFFPRLKGHKHVLEAYLRESVDDADFKGVNLEELLGGVRDRS
ncbi:MAG TPA: hypothetical protein VGR73_14030 [Bryobacteraceae bacterium]|nr:hypothetical protein [Bryobacteraceae bacterium]